MTQKQIEQTRVIAEKDGYVSGHKIVKYTDGSSVIVPVPNYLTDLNALHKVAMDVIDELKRNGNNPIWMGRKERYACFCNARYIRNSFECRPINGQYIDLFNAVYESIVFLNENKK